MSSYPFARGEHPVGVRSAQITDPRRPGRVLDTEIWYPATAAHAGQDEAVDTRDAYSLAPALPTSRQRAVRDAAACAGRFPLVLFSHGFGGHRRQSTFLCTHLVSHGYVVAAADHAGNTFVELVERMTSRPPAGAPRRKSMLEETMAERPLDVGLLIDELCAGQGVPAGVDLDATRIGISGHSLGGWTALAAMSSEPRLRAAAMFAPAGGAAKLRRELDFEWGRKVPVLFLAAARDSILALPAVRELFADIPDPKQMLIIDNADHMHFADASKRVHEMLRRLPGMDKALMPHQPFPPFDELCSAPAVHEVARGLALAHFDAHLAVRPEATAFLDGDLDTVLVVRNLTGEVLR